MRFLSVAERELRAAARHKATYRVRWITAAAFLALLVWMVWTFDALQKRGSGPAIFQALSILTFFYCLNVGTTRTADCLSSERREGTLGLLFLTNLNSAEIVAGKLCAGALSAVYGLFAIFPLLALPLLMGGVTFDHFWRTVLALVNTVFFSVAAGFAASAVCVRQFPAIALAIVTALFFSLGLMGIAEALRILGCPGYWVDGIAVLSPLYTLEAAEANRRLFGQNRYALSLIAVTALSWTWLAFVVWRVARTWRDRPRSARTADRPGLRQRLRMSGTAGRAALRRRLLRINPFFWLASRQRIGAPVFLLLTAVLVVITVQFTTGYFGRIMPGGMVRPLVGHLFAWLWTGLAIHVLVLYYAATAASQRLAEDKQTGALELILSTPVTERSVSRGLWLAYARKMSAPALIAVLVHFFFIWHGLTLFVLEPPSPLPAGITPGRLFWIALSGQAINGFSIDWHFGFVLRIFVLALVVLAANWIALGWVGRWLGLRMKHPGFAPMTAVALVLIPPWVLFSLVCYVFDELHIDRMPERQFLPLMMWIGFGIGIAHCLALSAWAAGRLQRDFRTTVTSRFQPPSVRRWWRPTLPSRRTVMRLAVGAAALALMVPAFHLYHNWRSRRAWSVFQQELTRTGESLDLSALLPGPVPDDRNFARTPGFQSLLNRNRAASSPAGSLLSALEDIENDSGAFNPFPPQWTQKRFTAFDEQLAWIQPQGNPAANTDPRQAASSVLEGLQPLTETLRATAMAAHLPSFQSSTNRDASAVLRANRRALVALEQLHFLFQLRASGLLFLDRPAEAAEDVLTSLRLARLARQSPDLRSSIRVQVMLTRALQPLWEGLAEHRWSEPQLAAIQSELARFDLLSDHTNAIRRVVRAYIEAWRKIPEGHSGESARQRTGSFSGPAPSWQPRAWWFNNCIQLYRAGERVIALVDVERTRVRAEYTWNDLSELPLDGQASQLLQQAYWWGQHPASVAFAQTVANQSIIACTLERHRLARGAYPENLDELVPTYLDAIPRDVMTGRPMNYQLTDSGSYVLRGLGPNGVNDEKSKGGSDDWLWSYPVPTNAVPPAPSGEGAP